MLRTKKEIVKYIKERIEIAKNIAKVMYEKGNLKSCSKWQYVQFELEDLLEEIEG